MGSRVYDNDVTTSTVTDNRVGVADQATLFNSQNGSSQSVTITNNTTDGAVLRDLATSNNATVLALINAAKDENAALLTAQTRSFKDAADVAERAARASADASGEALTEGLRFARDNAEDAFRFAQNVNDGVLTNYRDLGRIVSAEGDDNREFAKSIVDRTLAETRSADEKNIEKFLSAAKWIVGIVAVIMVVPAVFKGAK